MIKDSTLKPVDEVAQSTSVSVVDLREKAGPIQRVLTGMAVSGEAGRGLRELEAARVQAEVSIGKTAIALAATKIKTALVSRSMPAIGSLATTLNAATAAVDMALTNGTAAAAAAHVANRSENRMTIAGLQAAGKLDADEAQVLQSFVETDAADDIQRSRHRMADAKTAVNTLHSYALSNIQSARVDANSAS